MLTKDNQCRAIFSNRFNTNLLSARFTVSKIIVNIVRIFRMLELFLPPDRGIRLFSQLDRSNGVRVCACYTYGRVAKLICHLPQLIFHPECVEKIIPASARCTTDEEFHVLYNHIWATHRPASS